MSLGCYDEIGGGEFGQRLLAAIGDKRVPLSGGWDVTERCNLGCAHCYIRQAPGDRQRASRELSQAQICSILDQAVAEGCLWFLFTGGEPFLRPDFLEIYKHAKRIGLLPAIFTNATLLTPEIADQLVEWRPRSVEVTLYGATQEAYERVTGVPGSHARCMRGVELLLARDLPVGLKAMALQSNWREVPDMKAWAQSLGLEFRFDAMIAPRLDGRTENLSERLSPERSVQIDADDPERAEQWGLVAERASGNGRGSEQIYFCGAGLYSFHVDAYGRLSACGIARQPGYDLKQGTFMEGWHSFLGAVRQTERTQKTACQTCDVGAFCIQCPGWSQLVHGDNESPVEFLCQVGHLRAQAFAGSPEPILSEA